MTKLIVKSQPQNSTMADRLIEWMITARYAKNTYNAEGIMKGLQLYSFNGNIEDAKKLVIRYRNIRKATGEKAQACFEYALDPECPDPMELGEHCYITSMRNDVGDRRAKALKELGY